jgi:hypothetical protein
MKKLFLLPLLAGILFSCKTSQLTLSVTEPAPVTVPAYVKKVGVINRSMPTDETKAIDIVDKALSLEGVDLDKEGAMESIKGLSEELLQNERFIEVKALNNVDLRSSRLTVFPAPLSWVTVDRICKENNTDALFSLEKFDTDTRVNYSNRKVELKTPFGKIPGIEHQADVETIVKTGWRIYDPASNSILDEYVYTESVVSTGRGINPLLAIAAIAGRKGAVNEVSINAGRGYALRIVPYRLRVTRDYFVKGTDNFKIAKRRAQMDNWDGAGELWLKETENPKMKIAGRAAYNMAIISEINGNVDVAIEWAVKSYQDYDNKLAREYVNILRNRKYKNEVLDQQSER